MMQNKHAPCISVILPVYNGSSFLSQAIESILEQSYDDFELIIIDDGSSDGSLDIIEQFANNDKRIIVITRRNKGLVATLNEGISLAKGSWVARMDADDISLPKRFEIQLSKLKENRADICGSWVQRFGSFDNRVVKFPEREEAIKIEMLFGVPLAHPTVLMRAEILKKHLYNSEFSKAEDYDLWSRLIENGYKFINVQEVLLLYRVHDAQVSAQSAIQQYKQGQVIRRQYWFYIFNSLSLDNSLIDEVLKIFDLDKTDFNVNLVDSAFVSLLHKSQSEARVLLLKHLAKIYIKQSGNFSDNLIRWIKVNSEFGTGFGLKVASQILFFKTFNIKTDGSFFKKIRKISNFFK